MTWLWDAMLKSTALFALALAADWLLARRASAAVRHVVLVAALVGSILLPLVSLVAPVWRLPVTADATGVTFRANATPVAPPVAPVAAPVVRPAAAPVRVLDWTRLLTWLWLAGVAVVAARSIAGAWIIRRIARRAVPAEGVPPHVRLAERESMPLVFGIFRPVILVPGEFLEWPPAQRSMVLLHEEAHIARRDVLWQVLGETACALYWMNPLAWLVQLAALRRREAAADDRVLQAGVRASEYASRLLEMARSLRVPMLCRQLAMARPRQLEGRMLAILASGIERAPASPRAIASVAVLVAASAVTLAAMRPMAEDPVPVEARATAAARLFDFDGAVKEYRAAERATAEKFGGNSVEHARMLVKLAGALRVNGQGGEANQAVTEAIRIFQVVAPFDAAYAEALYRSGIWLQTAKDMAGAKAAYERGLEVARVAGERRFESRMHSALAMMAIGQGLGGSVESKLHLEEAAKFVEPVPAPVNPLAVPASPGTLRMKDGLDKAPALKRKVEPSYSDEARVQKWQTVVVLYVEVSETGKPENVRVLREAGLGLDEEAVRAVRQWAFEPATRKGQPVRVAATIEVNFRLL